MLSYMEAYFAAEKTESLVFLVFGMAVIVFAAFTLGRWRDPLIKGLAIPLLAVGAIQVAVGTTIFARTDAQVSSLMAQYQLAPASFRTQELARMKVVSDGFTIYKIIEAVFIAAGLLLALMPNARRFWRGFGLGMLVQGALMLPADLVAEDRAENYVKQIASIP